MQIFLKFYITCKNQELKKLCCLAVARLLHSGGSNCMAEARSVYQILEAHDVPRFK